MPNIFNQVEGHGQCPQCGQIFQFDWLDQFEEAEERDNCECGASLYIQVHWSPIYTTYLYHPENATEPDHD